MNYKQFKEDQQRRYNEFANQNIFYAFDNKQFTEGLKKFSLTPYNYQGKLTTTGSGGYLLIEKEPELIALMKQMDQERAAAIDADTTGKGFILEALRYELANHEYNITFSARDALDALGLSEKDLDRSNIKAGLKMALAEYL